MQRLKPAMLGVSLAVTANACASSAALDCSYLARETAGNPGHNEFQSQSRCAKLRPDGSLAVEPACLANLHFSDGVGAILVPTGWYYVTPAGRTARVLTYDNGPDYFEEGLARTIRSGKVGFVDRSLSEVIRPAWDFAFPFAGGYAVVCNGCRSYPVSDEHSQMRDGQWGYIDRSGRVVVPVTHDRDELPPPPASR